MEEMEIDLLYKNCPRFDEGELYRTRDFGAVSARRGRILDDLLCLMDGPTWILFQEFCGLCDDEAEFEARHFFRCGVLAALGEG